MGFEKLLCNREQKFYEQKLIVRSRLHTAAVKRKTSQTTQKADFEPCITFVVTLSRTAEGAGNTVRLQARGYGEVSLRFQLPAQWLASSIVGLKSPVKFSLLPLDN